MYERDAGQDRQDAARSSQRPRDSQRDEYERSQRGEMTRQAPSSTERAGTWDQGEQGGWTGYVVPYRYYGPGYRGVGYYSVMYQGSGEGEDQRATARGPVAAVAVGRQPAVRRPVGRRIRGAWPEGLPALGRADP